MAKLCVANNNVAKRTSRWVFTILIALTCRHARGDIPVGVDFSNNYTQFSETNGTVHVNLGGSAVPVGPTLSPAAQAWHKTLTLNSPNSNSPNIVDVNELVRFFPPISGGAQLPVTEWREQILTHGFVWTRGTLTEFDLGQIFVRTVGMGVIASSEITFQFAGTPISSDQFLYRYAKQIQWTGAGPRPSSIDVLQFPLTSVPEPGAVAIACIAMLSIAGRGPAGFAR